MSFWRFGLLIAIAHAQQCVTKQTISPGDGVTFPKTGDTVSMHYTGTLASTGAKFDSSRDRGKEFSTQIGVGRVIQGWDEGVPQMSLGERAILRISAACGYGAQGSPPTIPPNADLVFDVELLGINGQRATTSASTSSASVSAPASRLPSSTTLGGSLSSASLTTSASSSLTASSASSSSLPRCTSSSCGLAISWDPSGASKPVCMCSPLCVQWANQPGVLPCCPGLQEVCLNPLLGSSNSKATSTASANPVPASASVNTAPPARAPATLTASGSSTLSSSATSASSTPAASALPTCRPNSCGKAMALGLNSMTAVCACDVSCLSAGSSLPCCQSFREVCQSAPTPQPLIAAQTSFAAPPISVSQSQPSIAAQTTTSLAAPSSSVSQSLTSAPQQASARPASPAVTTAACSLGKTNWDEQKTCDKKRWAIQNNKCKKVCPPTDPQVSANVKSYPTGTGKDACAAQLKACKGA